VSDDLITPALKQLKQIKQWVKQYMG
jgi:hypothetical protein